MISKKLSTPQFGIYTHYAYGTVTRKDLPLLIDAHGYGNSHGEATADALRLARNVQPA